MASDAADLLTFFDKGNKSAKIGMNVQKYPLIFIPQADIIDKDWQRSLPAEKPAVLLSVTACRLLADLRLKIKSV